MKDRNFVPARSDDRFDISDAGVTHLLHLVDPDDDVFDDKLWPPIDNFGWLLDVSQKVELDVVTLDMLFSLIEEINEDVDVKKNAHIQLFLKCSDILGSLRFEDHVEEITGNLNRLVQRSGFDIENDETKMLRRHLKNVSEQSEVEKFLKTTQKILITRFIEQKYRQSKRRQSG